MSNDLVTLTLLSQELKDNLIIGKVTKINQPENDEIRLIIRNNGENYTLSVSSNPNAPRINITNDKKTNPITCPNFCMLLRKYLTNSTILDIAVQNNDRIIKITFENKDDLKYTKHYYLYVELINRYSNIIFTNEDNIILSAIRQISIDNIQKRPIVSGIKYEYLPANTKISIFDTENLVKILQNACGNIAEYISKNTSGITKESCVNLFECVDKTALNSDDINNIIDTINQIKSGEIRQKLHYYIYEKNGKFEYFFTKNSTLNYQKFDSLNDAMNYCNQLVDKDVRLKELTKNYYNLLHKYIIKTEKKIKINQNKLTECKEKDIYKKYGELLTANIYLLKKGMSELAVKDYYNDYTDLVIKLDEKLSPKENIALYYKKYTKLKNAENITYQQLEINTNALEYANAILSDLNNIKYGDSLDDIKEELALIGLFKQKNNSKVRKEKISPYIYEVEGFTIIAGKNNLQNDYITFKIANSKDTWCHVKNSHGSHIIAFRKDGELAENVLKIALEIAGYYSANNSNKVEVDYTIRQNVTRKDKNHKGLVNYTNYKTALVTPNQHLEYLVKQ